jgi:hypothetical protein
MPTPHVTGRPSFPCPFTNCKHTYAKKSQLKSHLRILRGGDFDEKHPADDPLWDSLQREDFLKIHTRPRDLSEPQREQRRAAAQKRNYVRNKHDILQRQQELRADLNSTLQDLSREAQLVKERNDNRQNVLDGLSSNVKVLYPGNSEEYALDAFLKDHPNVDSSFPFIVAYFLRPSARPDLRFLKPNETKYLNVIPTAHHWRLVSNLVHPDKNYPDPTLQAKFNVGYDYWQPVLEAPELATEIVNEFVLISPTDTGPRDEWSKRSEFHRPGAHLFYKYAVASQAAANLTPPNADISIAEVHQLVSFAEDALKEEPVLDRFIESAMKIPDIKRRRKRKALDEDSDRGDSSDRDASMERQCIDPSLTMARTRSGIQCVSRS